MNENENSIPESGVLVSDGSIFNICYLNDIEKIYYGCSVWRVVMKVIRLDLKEVKHRERAIWNTSSSIIIFIFET